MNTSSAQAQLFTQDFSSSTVVADYVSATPSNGQFNSISTSGAGTTVSINGGTLQFVRSGANAGSFSRTTDFAPMPTSLIYKMDITVSGNTVAATTAAVFQVGSGFGTANSAESNANTYARFGINLSATAGCFSIRNLTAGTNSAEFCGTQTITLVLNNSGGTLSYTAPGGTTQTVANDTEDLYVGTTLVFDDVAVQTPTQTITDLKFTFTNGSATIQLDNILIDPIPTGVTAATVNVGGRVTNSKNRGIARATVSMTDGSGNRFAVYTDSLGYYRFEEVEVGQTLIFDVRAKGYNFTQPTQLVSLTEEAATIDFKAYESKNFDLRNP